MAVPVGVGEEWCAIHETKLPDDRTTGLSASNITAIGTAPASTAPAAKTYVDNAERFAFLSRAALQVCKAMHWTPDVVHAHDWQTGLMPVMLKAHYAGDPILGKAASVFTIHNVGYQGEFYKEQIHHAQLGWEWFSPTGVEFHDRLNYMKAGIAFADKVSTVSQRYASEIQTVEGGFGSRRRAAIAGGRSRRHRQRPRLRRVGSFDRQTHHRRNSMSTTSPAKRSARRRSQKEYRTAGESRRSGRQHGEPARVSEGHRRTRGRAAGDPQDGLAVRGARLRRSLGELRLRRSRQSISRRRPTRSSASTKPVPIASMPAPISS